MGKTGRRRHDEIERTTTKQRRYRMMRNVTVSSSSLPLHHPLSTCSYLEIFDPQEYKGVQREERRKKNHFQLAKRTKKQFKSPPI
jgi:hypothetical protein